MKFCLFAFALLLVLLKTNKYNLQQSILNSIYMLFWTTLWHDKWTTVILPLVISTKQLKKDIEFAVTHPEYSLSTEDSQKQSTA